MTPQEPRLSRRYWLDHGEGEYIDVTLSVERERGKLRDLEREGEYVVRTYDDLSGMTDEAIDRLREALR